MLDIKRIRANADEVIAGLAKRGIVGVVEKMKQIDSERRELIVKTETLKAKRNEVSKQIPVMKRAGENVDELLSEMKQVSDDVKAIDADLAVLDEQLNGLLLSTPNLPHEDVPVGDSEEDERRRVRRSLRERNLSVDRDPDRFGVHGPFTELCLNVAQPLLRGGVVDERSTVEDDLCRERRGDPHTAAGTHE